MGATDVGTLIPGKQYKVRAEDCCLTISFHAMFIEIKPCKWSEWPITVWGAGIEVKAKELYCEEVK